MAVYTHWEDAALSVTAGEGRSGQQKFYPSIPLLAYEPVGLEE